MCCVCVLCVCVCVCGGGGGGGGGGGMGGTCFTADGIPLAGILFEPRFFVMGLVLAIFAQPFFFYRSWFKKTKIDVWGNILGHFFKVL